RWRNDPYMTRQDLLAWQDWAIGQIREAEHDFGLPRHAISLSPDPHGIREGAAIVLRDLQAWQDLQSAGTLKHFTDVDLVVLHGQPFFGTSSDPTQVRSQLRISLLPFVERFPGVAWELSSDGLNGPQHWAKDTSCGGSMRSLSQLRHGFFSLPV